MMTAVATMLMTATIAAAGVDLPTIRWDPATLRLVERGGDYARMVRLRDGRVACGYDRGGKLYLRRSEDQGMTWEAPVLVDADPDCWLTNAELLVTRGGAGALLYFWDERPRKAVRMQGKPARAGELTRPFLIRMAKSRDHGRTWSRPQTLYTGGCTFEDGCWEPSPIQLPSGEILVFFANEAPYTQTDEQEISVLRSRDGGETWGDGKAETFAMRPKHRDGMPVPALLADGGLAVAVEDNGLPGGGGRFKPSILRREPGGGGGGGVIGGDGPNRWGALDPPLEPSWYAGAPYLRTLPSGFTILSYQEGRSGELRGSRMAVCVGDAFARGFTHRTYPIDGDPGTSQLWNALFVKDEHTVTAISGATVRGVRGIWAIDGKTD